MSDDVLETYDLEQADIIVVNETEAIELLAQLRGPGAAGEKSEKVVDALSARFSKVEAIIVTLGANGLVARFGRGANAMTLRIPAVKVKNVVDTTGAGDTFIGFLVAGLIELGWTPGVKFERASIETVLKHATAASALNIQKHGAMESIPSREEVLAAIKR
jgi:ribokinase